ncbi:hypothetical protein ACXYTP_23380 [Tsukamurella ocularis]
MNKFAGLAVALLAVGLVGCANATSGAPTATASDASSAAVETSQAGGREDTAGYLAATRKGTTDDVPDAKLLEIGRTLCMELRRGEWKKTVLDDGPMVAGISVPMRINAGFAAVHYLCTDQEADYLRRVAGGS